MKFVADSMLGKLARWLRLAGHDVTYISDFKVPASEQDDVLLEQAKLEQRVLLTCDLGLHRRAKRAGIRSAYVESNDVVRQLVEVSKRCRQKIEIRSENSRCPMCNGSLKLVSKDDVKNLVPATVLKAQREFWRCGKCGKIYWHGTHWNTILEMASRYNRIAG